MGNTAATSKIVKFKEYNSFFYSIDFFDFLGKRDSQYVNLPDENDALDIKNKYIYVFKKSPYTTAEDGYNVYLNREIYANEEGKYQLVYGEQRNQKASATDEVVLEITEAGAEITYFFCLSQIQFSWKRIKMIRKQIHEGILHRVKQLPFFHTAADWKQAPDNWWDVKFEDDLRNTFFLTDYLAYAEKLSVQYVRNREEYIDYMSANMAIGTSIGGVETHPRNQLAMLSDIVYNLCNIEGRESRYRDHVTWHKAQSWRDNFLKVQYDYISAYQVCAYDFVRWIDTPCFHAVLYDYEFSDNEEDVYFIENKVGELVVRFAESIKGQEYFYEAYKEIQTTLKELEETYGKDKGTADEVLEINQEKNWFVALFFSGRKLTLGFSSIVTAFSRAIVQVTIEVEPVLTATEVLSKIVDRRFATGFVSTTPQKLARYKSRYPNLDVWKNALQQQYKKTLGTLTFQEENGVVFAYYKKAHVAEMTSETATEQIKRNWASRIKDSGALNKLLIAIEIFNLAMAVWALVSGSEDDRLINTISLAGAIVDLMIQIVSKETTKAMLGIVSGVIEAVVFSANAYSRFELGDDDAGGFYAGAAVGGIACAVGSTITLVAWISAGAAGGAAAGGPPGAVVGAIIGAIGAVIQAVCVALAIYFTDDDFEIWLEHCLWGRSYGQDEGDTNWSKGPLSGWRNNIEIQIQTFNNICYDCNIDLVYMPYPYAGFRHNRLGLMELEIKPRFLDPASKMYISVFIVAEKDVIELAKNLEILEAGNYSYLYRAEQKIEYMYVRWCDKQKYAQALKFELEYQISSRIENYMMTFWSESTGSLEVLKQQALDALMSDVIRVEDLSGSILIRSYDGRGGVKPLKVMVSVRLDVFGNGQVEIKKEKEFYIQADHPTELEFMEYSDEIRTYKNIDAVTH